MNVESHYKGEQEARKEYEGGKSIHGAKRSA